MTKQQVENVLTAIQVIKGSANFNVMLLLSSGHKLAGKVFAPVGTQGFVRIDVTRIEGANLRDGPVPSWVDLDAIQVVALD